ncbi:MAG: [protein-PII] uridylyltransferase [Acidobacteria bacterium]|nr:[protein-PII] uridylyltransferase [Acidobacteriota bacterium]
MQERLEQIRERFLASGGGLEAVSERACAVDEAVERLYAGVCGPGETSGATILAVGGYGRRQLFPWSDVDLLFLFEKQGQAEAARDAIAAFLRQLWDAGMRASHSVRTPEECTSLINGNTELHISLLDARYLAGDRAIAARLAERLTSFYVREREELVRRLARLARDRHARHGDTIYHLEPNIKEAPGGLRDFQLSCWLAQLNHVSRSAPLAPAHCPETFLPEDCRAEGLEAKRFLFALRCYLHYLNGRDNNILTFEHQERIAVEGGASLARPAAAAWMREYFRRARTIHRLAERMMEETGAPEHSLFALFRDRKSRLSNADFAVARGRVFLRRPEALESEPGMVLRLFEFIARHGLPIAAETERRIKSALAVFRLHLEQARRFELRLWDTVASILRLPHPYQALAAMRETGVLAALFPELERIDCLVVRDFYHRYTVDEHSLQAIRALEELRRADNELSRPLAGLLEETGQPELLLFALLFHDSGKGGEGGSHVSASLELAEGAMDRLRMDEQDREAVRFLIRHHLEMSATMTGRDLADPATAQAFAARVGTIERLRQLTLMTYADLAAVNPEALTPWRQDLLRQLYLATCRQLTREMEASRIGPAEAPLAAQLAATEADQATICRFLEGLPKRYLLTHSPEQIARHLRLEETFRRKSVAMSLELRHAIYELVLLASDRPYLLASIAGTLASFAMNILKAEAYSNSSGMVLDTFVFADPLRNLELNPSETDRLLSTLERVILGKIDVRELLARRPAPPPRRQARILSQVSFDNQLSAAETVFHVIAADRPGLLYDLAAAFSFSRCDIDVVLIDTKGYKAIDVFYVRSGGRKLSEEKARQLAGELERACAGESRE